METARELSGSNPGLQLIETVVRHTARKAAAVIGRPRPPPLHRSVAAEALNPSLLKREVKVGSVIAIYFYFFWLYFPLQLPTSPGSSNSIFPDAGLHE